MITEQKSKEIALYYLKAMETDAGISLKLSDKILEKDYGWVFFYQSRDFLELGLADRALAGNSPFIVSREDGSIHETGTALPIEAYLLEFEKNFYAK